MRILLAPLALALLAAAPAPGRWDLTIKPNAIPIPGSLGREAQLQLQRMMTEPATARVCLKRRAPDASALFTFKGEKACSAATVAFGADGRVTGTAQCTESDRPMAATIAGEASARRLTYSVTRVSGGLDRAGTVAATVEGVRKGGC